MDLSHFVISSNILALTTATKIFYSCYSKGRTKVPTDFHPDTFRIGLGGNRISSIPSYSFVNLTKCKFIRLEDNRIEIIHSYAFQNLPKLSELDLKRNKLSQIETHAFGNLPSISEMNLGQNVLPIVESDNFKRLSNLRDLKLFGNVISVIEPNAFKNLINLVTLQLQNNKLIALDFNTFAGLISLNTLYMCCNNITQIGKRTFSSLKQLKELQLRKNNIKEIKEGTFTFVNSNNSFKREIYIQENKIQNLSWKSFVHMPFTQSMRELKKSLSNVEIEMHTNKFSCNLTLCWIIQGLRDSWFHATKYQMGDPPYGWMDAFSTKTSCYDFLVKECPDTDRCMPHNSTRCTHLCIEEDYATGTLTMKDFLCPFEYFCDCKCLDSVNCSTECAKEGKVDRGITKEKTGCEICKCQCATPNCKLQCSGENFEVVTNIFGCLDCNCTCPVIDCNAQCGGKGLGIQNISIIGCKTCTGCKHEDKPSLPVALSSVFGLIAAFSIGGTIVYSLRMKQNKEKPSHEELKVLETTESELEVLVKNLQPTLATEIRKCFIEPGGIEVNQLLGRGHFGIVWSGTFKKSYNKRRINVAVKRLKGEYNDVWHHENKWTKDNELKPCFTKMKLMIELDRQIVIDFLTEATVMRNFNHPNILKMFGVSVHEGKPCIILPLMTNGDLRKFVKLKYLTLTFQDLLTFAICVAQGMEHLAEHNFVHRDLAARNCMLDENLVVKVCDFGLAKDMDEDSYYRSEDNTVALPVRWMSIEAIQKNLFTSKSDMWSYGVVLWEVFSGGGHPYKDLANNEVEPYLRTGKRLHRPPHTSNNMYEAMLECWNEDPEARPTFTSMISKLDKYLDDQAEYMKMTEAPVSTFSPDRQAKKKP